MLKELNLSRIRLLSMKRILQLTIGKRDIIGRSPWQEQTLSHQLQPIVSYHQDVPGAKPPPMSKVA